MSDVKNLKGTLDSIATRAANAMTEGRAKSAFADGLRRGLPMLAAIPGLVALSQLGQWTKNEPALGIPLLLVAVLTVAAPLVYAWTRAKSVRKDGVARTSALGEVDRQVKLEGRLLAADEFVGRADRSSFENAAIEDAQDKTAVAANAALAVEPGRMDIRRPAALWAAGGLGLLGLAAWFATWERTPKRPAPDAQTAAAGDAVAIPDDVPEQAKSVKEPRAVEPLAPEAGRKKGQSSEPQSADASPQVTQDAKESSGKTGAGKSSGAMSSSAASESKSSPSSAGQKSDPSKNTAKPKKADKKKPKETGAEPEEQERPEDEQSGATAGKGSSKGSNKNPTASDWKSRDQVTDADDQEVEDDEETDEDEEEQENRGGVQPSLRDRRPPVSRDLQIGFGNRPSPDANGRGGPSEQKKSRGVASLVLGVPIPDRIKGRPGPGPTKITQERIEPEAEEATAIQAAARRARDNSMEKPTALTLDSSIRSLVRDYFLKQRSIL